MGETAAVTMLEKITAMTKWANDHIGKIPGPVRVGPHAVIGNPDFYLQTQLKIMETYQPRALMHTAAYMRIWQLKSFIENQSHDIS